MKFFDTISESVAKALADRGVDTEKLLYCVKCDMDGDGSFLDTYVAFDGETLCCISGTERIIRTRKKYHSSFEFDSYREYRLSDITELYVDRYRHTARLMGRYKKESPDDEQREEVIARFSLGFAEKAEHFCKRYNMTVRGEEIDDTLLEENNPFCPGCGQRYPDPNRKFCPYCVKRSSLFRRLLGMFSRFRAQAAAIMIMMVLSSILSIIAPYFGTALLYDNVLAEEGSLYGEVFAAVIMMAGFQLLSGGFSTLYGVVFSRAVAKVMHTLRTSVFAAMERLSLSFFTSKQTGSLMTRVDRDAGDVYDFFTFIVPQGITNVIKMATIVVLMLAISPALAVCILGLMSLVLASELWFVRGQRRHWRNRNFAVRGVNSVLNDAVNGHRVVKAFAREEQEKSRFDKKVTALFRADYDGDVRYTKFDSSQGAIYNIGSAVLTVFGFYLVITGEIGIGRLMLLTSYFGMMWDPIYFFIYAGNDWSRCTDAASRIFEILDSEPTVKPPATPAAVDKQGLRGDISLKQVGFEYQAGVPVIKNLTADIKAGQFFGIVGKTGAGKSTLINLISRLYDVTSGEITIDGIPIKDIAFSDLRRSIGIVSQESYLFMGSIADNIRYARPDATIEEVIEAAKNANAHDFIIKMPDGYDTRIGQGGVSLSGGEKQRLSIARALIQKPNILILDEATASMDTRTERKIQSAIDNLKKGRTIIAIAHRLSTLRDADVLCVIEKGEVKEMGDHDTLIRQRGKYFELYKLQSEALRSIGVE